MRVERDRAGVEIDDCPGCGGTHLDLDIESLEVYCWDCSWSAPVEDLP